MPAIKRAACLDIRLLLCNRVSQYRTNYIKSSAAFRALLRLRRRKGFAGWRAHALVDEALEAAAVEILANVDVAFAVDCKRMRHVQRSAEDSLLPEMIEDLERLTQQNPDVVVGAVDHIEEA